MINPALDDDEKPLDPAVERIQQKLRRLLLISGGIMGIGLLAVFSVILYRVVKTDAPPAVTGPAEATIALPAGIAGKVVASSLDGNRLVLTVQSETEMKFLVFDLETASVVQTLTLEPPLR